MCSVLLSECIVYAPEWTEIVWFYLPVWYCLLLHSEGLFPRHYVLYMPALWLYANPLIILNITIKDQLKQSILAIRSTLIWCCHYKNFIDFFFFWHFAYGKVSQLFEVMWLFHVCAVTTSFGIQNLLSTDRPITPCSYIQ